MSGDAAGRPGRILVVDDEEDWREVLFATLSPQGYLVELAETKQVAADFLAKEFYHLVVLDILMDERQPESEEGLELLRELRVLQHGKTVAVTVLSGHGNDERMREAFRDFQVADFLDKLDFVDIEFVAYVKSLFRDKLLINLNLSLHWQAGLDPSAAVNNLLVDGSRIKGKGKDRTDQEKAAAERCAAELDDLLCRLFHQAESVLLRRLGEGWSGTGTLWVQPFYRHGGARPVVLKYGDVQAIDREQRNFAEYVEPYVGGGRCTHVQSQRQTPHLGGILYSLLGEGGDHLEDFAAFYRRADSPEIVRTLDHLFRNTCKDWYANKGQVCILDLTRHYMSNFGLHAEVVGKAWHESLKSVQGDQSVHFQSLSERRAFRNPMASLSGPPIELPTYLAITHGDFNDQNILVDGAGHCWLIDFQRTGLGHLLRDVIQLDAVIRITLLAPEEATLDERLALEESLDAGDSFSGFATALRAAPRAANPSVAKAFAACAHLRGIAAELVAQNPRADIAEYYAGSLFVALNMVRFRRLASRLREHAMLSACLLADRLRL